MNSRSSVVRAPRHSDTWRGDRYRSAPAGSVMADRTLAYLRAALNWYEARTDDWRSPVVRGMVRTGARERTRVLDDAELRKLFAQAQA